LKPNQTSTQLLIPILNDEMYPIMTGLKVFSLQLTPINNNNNNNNKTMTSLDCDLIAPNNINIIIDDRLDDAITIGFNYTHLQVNETQKEVNLPIVRIGDLSQKISIICYTQQQTATEGKDYIGRSSIDSTSIVHFNQGDRVKHCTIRLIDDSIFEADETLQVKLMMTQIDNEKPTILDAQLAQATVTINDIEDACVVSLEKDHFTIDEPTNSNMIVKIPIGIKRTGDVSHSTQVRVSTSDGTALAGLDYKPATQMITFQPGVSFVDFKIQILFDNINETQQPEHFYVTLGPQAPISAIFGEIRKSTIQIIDRPNGDQNTPMIGSNLITEMTSNNEYLTCIDICDHQNPYHASNQQFCSQNEPIFSWEMSQTSLGDEKFYKLTQKSLFNMSTVDTPRLEAIFMRPGHVRCTTNYLNKKSHNLLPLSVKSNVIQIDSNSNSDSNCLKVWRERDGDLYESNGGGGGGEVGGLFHFRFKAKAEYISADFIRTNPKEISVNYMNFIRLTIKVPFINGMTPLISTKPLSNYNYLIKTQAQQQQQQHHICSNFIAKKGQLRFGFLNIETYQQFLTNRNKSECHWLFTGYFDITELVTHCDAQIISTSIGPNSDRNESHLTIQIPVYAAYIYNSGNNEWSGVEYKSFVETSIVYKTSKTVNNDFFNNIFEPVGNDDVTFDISQLQPSLPPPSVSKLFRDDKSMVTLGITKVSLDNEGRLVIEFQTNSLFKGKIVERHVKLPNYSSTLTGVNTKFDLEFIANVNNNISQQIWRATSRNIQKSDDIGNFTVELIPCFFITGVPPPTNSDNSCQPEKPFVKIEISSLNFLTKLKKLTKTKNENESMLFKETTTIQTVVVRYLLPFVIFVLLSLVIILVYLFITNHNRKQLMNNNIEDDDANNEELNISKSIDNTTTINNINRILSSEESIMNTTQSSSSSSSSSSQSVIEIQNIDHSQKDQNNSSFFSNGILRRLSNNFNIKRLISKYNNNNVDITNKKQRQSKSDFETEEEEEEEEVEEEVEEEEAAKQPNRDSMILTVTSPLLRCIDDCDDIEQYTINDDLKAQPIFITNKSHHHQMGEIMKINLKNQMSKSKNSQNFNDQQEEDEPEEEEIVEQKHSKSILSFGFKFFKK
jgi:hypothetical protein